MRVTMVREPYDVLGVARSATWREVRSAYLALARRYHPDGRTPDVSRMAEVNGAYEELERRRRQPTETPRPLVPTGPGHAVAASPAPAARPQAGSLLWRIQAARQPETPVLDFGQYAGWRVSEVARHDPRYLVWLSRHSSGARYRRAIELVLGTDPDIGRRAALIG